MDPQGEGKNRHGRAFSRASRSVREGDRKPPSPRSAHPRNARAQPAIFTRCDRGAAAPRAEENRPKSLLSKRHSGQIQKIESEEVEWVGPGPLHFCRWALPSGSSAGSLKRGRSRVERPANSQPARGFRRSPRSFFSTLHAFTACGATEIQFLSQSHNYFSVSVFPIGSLTS